MIRCHAIMIFFVCLFVAFSYEVSFEYCFYFVTRDAPAILTNDDIDYKFFIFNFQYFFFFFRVN